MRAELHLFDVVIRGPEKLELRVLLQRLDQVRIFHGIDTTILLVAVLSQNLVWIFGFAALGTFLNLALLKE